MRRDIDIPTYASAVVFGCDDALVDTWELDRAVRIEGGSFLEPSPELVSYYLCPDDEKVRLLEALVKAGCRIAVCSRRSSQALESMLAQVGALPYISYWQGANGFAQPGPALYRSALVALGCCPEMGTIIENTRMSLSAKQAGAYRVLEVAGSEDVDLQLLPHVLDISYEMQVETPITRWASSKMGACSTPIWGEPAFPLADCA